jgi:hypothetical protein
MNEKALIYNNGWTSFDPVDSGLLERLSKKNILEGEEKLMLAVLGRLLNIFRNMSLQRMRGERNYSKKRKNGFWTRIATRSILLKISVRSWGCILIICVRATVLEGGKAQASCKASQLSSHTLTLKQMLRYFSRSCPRCGSFFGLVFRQPSSQSRVLFVDGLCVSCRYGINWALVRGRALTIKVHKKRLRIRAVPKTL